ncbi:flavodoxin domain-containing protein [Salinispira pacifica]|uniref:Flavodoxin domain-containing protein n=1 Tax=Salinispira pacifica TaxID=1307761 RepID=V5WK87_9SPIO|nr:flavodoxin domain-containing protein [Salinispira pacifica]AHC16232.1 hypothetical protein L21SP2_2884 [Salinispira pacifica]
MVLIVFSSRGGATKDIALKIQEGLRTSGIKADVEDVKNKPDPSAYSTVILGAGIRAGSITGAMKRYWQRNEEELTQRALLLYVSSMARGETGKEYVDSNFSPRLLAHARFAGSCGGRIRLEELSGFARFILKKVASITENQESLDEKSIETIIQTAQSAED